MENKKYIGSDVRFYLSYTTMQMGIDDTMLDIHFREDELNGERSDFIKAFGILMRYAIRKKPFYEVKNHNLARCINDKYIRMFIDGTAEPDKIKETLINACSFIEVIKIKQDDTSPNTVLVLKYENDIRALATEIKNDLIDGTGYKTSGQFIPFN